MEEKIKELKEEYAKLTKKGIELQHAISIKQKELNEIGRECFRLESQIKILEEMRTKNG